MMLFAMVLCMRSIYVIYIDIYIYIILIAVFCVCVCVFVIFEIPGTGGRSATPLAPMWRASPGELQRLLLESTRRMVREKKPLKVLRR